MPDRVELQPPPVAAPREAATGAWVNAVPMLGSLGSFALIAASLGGGSRSYLAGGSVLVATLAFVLLQNDRQRCQRRHALDAMRRSYLAHLADVRRSLHATGARRCGVQWGTGPAPLVEPLVPPDIPSGADPVCVAAMRRLVTAWREPPGQPLLVTTALARIPAVGEAGRAVARAMIRRLPAGVAVGVLTTDQEAWEWLAWVPSAWSQRERDALGGRRMVCATWAELEELLPTEGAMLVIDERHDGGSVPERPGRTVVAIGGTVGEALDLQRADTVDLPTTEAWARGLTRPRSEPAADRDLAALLGTDPVRWTGWPPRGPADHLRVPIGLDDVDQPVLLDLEEAARGGVGPHGLLVGATGSGKSELLRTLVTGLVLTHSPADLTLVLVDFKGGATFAGLEGLPHVSALITNLADDLALVDRMHDALTGELLRRQEALRIGGLSSVDEHPGLPHTLVVVDEFSELLAVRPELLDLFVQIGRLGRSLGLHLLLASQRLEEGRLRGLESHLSYRIGLRTFSAAESRAVIGVPDAHALPSTPGVGFLRTGPDDLRRFTASYAGAAVRPESGSRILPITTAEVPVATQTPARSLVDLAGAALTGRGTPAARIWLPPLSAAPLTSELPSGGVALVDRPREQRHEPLLLDLAGAAGHVAIVGAPRSGKSTLALSVACAHAAERSPADLQVYALDLGAGLTALDELPHLAGRATRGQSELAHRIVRLLRSAADSRVSAADGPRLVLVVDGLGALRAEWPELEPVLHDIAARGLAVGVHLIVTGHRWAELRPGFRDLFGSRLELRLGDPLDSEVDRRAAALVPAGPGHGLTTDGHPFLAALPDVSHVAARWPGERPPRLRELPTHVPLGTLTRGEGPGVVLGADDAGRPVLLEGSLLVVGDPGSGRTTTLRTVAAQAPGKVVLVDPRRALLDVVPADRLLHHLALPSEIRDAVADLAAYLTRRLPGPTVTPDALRRRAWWSGPDVHLLVDDHDLVALGGDPLAPLLPLLPHARDLGLHVVVARRASGAARALHEPVLRTLRDIGAAAAVLSATAEEGPLFGVRPVRQPPGRAHLVTCDRTVLLQVAVPEPVE